MSGNNVNRRDFLKIMGLGGASAATLTGCDMPTTITLEEGKEKVVSYVSPEEFVIPGIGVWYASTCLQCSAGCGLHGRVREGRVLKVEGNPDSAVNGGGLCTMGQAGLQGHYNPDRITKPMARKGGSLTEISWDDAWALLDEKSKGAKAAWLTGSITGHQAALFSAYQKSSGAKAYHYEVINNTVAEAVNEAVLGEAVPRYRLDKAKSILSLGADFLGTWVSPVHFSKEYAKFRSGDRGVLIQAEPKMTLTGGNADLWLALRPGTEGVLALGIANVLLSDHGADGSRISAAARSSVAGYTPAKVAEITGVSAELIAKAAGHLNAHSPSLVLTGASAQGHNAGYQVAAAAMLLNLLLGAVGETIESAGEYPYPELQPQSTGTASLTAFTQSVEQGGVEVAFVYGANPLFTAPTSTGFAAAFAKVPFKVVLSMFPDETTSAADLVLPLASAFEDWGSSVAPYQGADQIISVQQPLMQPLYSETKGFGDILLALLKRAGQSEYAQYDDYYAYLRSGFDSISADWATSLQRGLIKVSSKAGSALNKNSIDVSQAEYRVNSDYPLHLVPSARQGLWDGRHANLPWLQEAPDQISKVFWDSWAEIHPKTAARLGVSEGDVIRIESPEGVIETQVYIYRGVHPDVVAVPMGQGHDAHGRYAKGVGVNPLSILSPTADERTGELAMFATRVKVSATGAGSELPRLGGNDRQLGRRLVGTVSADIFRKTEGGGHVA